MATTRRRDPAWRDLVPATASGVLGAALWAAVEPLDQRAFGFRYSDALNITEDRAVAQPELARPLRPHEIKLLHSPLPPDLPTTNKDILILMAAYEGNIDRYVRLRRPFFIRNELNCLVRGIYNSTTFARWWLDALLENPNPPAVAKRHADRPAVPCRAVSEPGAARSITD